MVMRKCVLLAAFLAAAAPALAQPSRSNPYRNLFKPRDLKEVARSQPQAMTPDGPRVVCGMTVIPINPDTDPRFVKPIPDSSTHYTMRVIPPAICK